MSTNPADLVDYEDEVEETNQDAVQETDGVKKGHYVGIHSTGFKDFFLKPEIMRAVTECGFEHPSEVQHVCIPQIMAGMDVLCQAKSGMGKTAVFVISTLESMKPVKGEVSILVLCHTRELAFQIKHEYDRFSKYLPDVHTEAFYGGIDIKENLANIQDKQPNIVVGTPGRIKDLANRKALDLSHIKFFVVDECDRMIAEIGMRQDVQAIFSLTPHDKQVMMFSATLSEAVKPKCLRFMQNPFKIELDENKLTLHGLQQYFVKLNEEEKTRKLIDLLDNLQFNQVVIFVSKVSRTRELDRLLRESNFPSIAMHAKMRQEERIQRYKDFKDYKYRVLVATDLFGRGIDIERVNIVINYDFPDSSDTYLHRVGRAGRFGTKGLAISFISTDEDVQIVNDVQMRFEVNIGELPETIDTNDYMN